jgi:hypothetical protein
VIPAERLSGRAAGQFYNQVISGHHYLTQEEFSNRSFFQSGGGCLQRP